MERRLTLPDPDDRHVLAAALACVADVIVTYNTNDSPETTLLPFGISAVTPDDLMCELFDSGIVTTAAARHRASLTRPPMTPAEYVEAVRRNGMPDTADALPQDEI